MIFVLYALALVGLSGLPTLLVMRNLPLFHRAPKCEDAVDQARGPVSVLIPARDEESGIADAVHAVLRNQDVEFEVIVMDDASTDQTPAIVSQIASRDSRVRLSQAPKLPDGWNGKQHACWQLAQLAKFDRLLFMDADVRLEKEALCRMVEELDRSGVALTSGFPRQITLSVSEQLLIPMMHFVLLGYLPLDRMRATCQPQFGAGCGQLFLATRTAYFAAGGHESIRSSRHDGLKLPRAFRAAGLQTDLFDASDIASVRMYAGWNEVSRGLLKNANEAIANSKLIALFTCLLLGASVLPILSFAHALVYRWNALPTSLLGVATVFSFLPRALIAGRLHQSTLGVLAHPVAVAIFVGLQWLAFIRAWLGTAPIAWRGRH